MAISVKRRCVTCKYFVPEDVPWGDDSLGFGYGTCRLREISVRGTDGCPSWTPKRSVDE